MAQGLQHRTMKMINRKDKEACRERRRDVVCECGHRKHWLKNGQWVCGKCGHLFVDVDVSGEVVSVSSKKWFEFWK